MTTKTSFATPVQPSIKAVEELMRKQAVDRHPDLAAALELLLSSGGKRVRTVLTLLTGSMLHADPQRLITLAAAIEMLHTATLVHDDLIDGSLLRRGMPTLNSQWSAGATVLTGDFVFACAARLAAETDSIPVMHLFSSTLGTIVNGEITQLFSSRCLASREDYFRRIYAKTASLFETSAKAAALLSAVSAEEVEHMRFFGYQIGMAFQIVDDILDFTGEQTTLGKPVGSDLRQGLITLPTICFIETNPDSPYSQRLLTGKCSFDETQANELVGLIRSSSAIRLALQEACDYVDAGLAALNHFPSCPERDALQELATFFLNRDL